MTSWLKNVHTKRIMKSIEPIESIESIKKIEKIEKIEKCYEPYLFDNHPILIRLIKKYKYEFEMRNIKKIINVYKPMYIEKKANGLGDFLRGSYCIEQICNILDIEFDLNIIHPIHKVLECKDDIPDTILDTIKHHNILNQYIGKNIEYISDTKTYINFIDTILHIILHSPIYNNIVYAYIIAFPIFKIQERTRNIIKNKLVCNTYMQSYIADIINKYDLIKYHIIHIRSGDIFILQKDTIVIENYKTYLENLIKIIKDNIINDTIISYCLICDSNIIKNYISEKIPELITINNKIIHLGDGILTDENIKYTMIDYYLLSLSTSIISISSYGHGSGFSKWCAETYNIPYKCIYNPC